MYFCDISTEITLRKKLFEGANELKIKTNYFSAYRAAHPSCRCHHFGSLQYELQDCHRYLPIKGNLL